MLKSFPGDCVQKKHKLLIVVFSVLSFYVKHVLKGTGAFGRRGLHARPHAATATSLGSVSATTPRHLKGAKVVPAAPGRQDRATTRSVPVRMGSHERRAAVFGR